MDFPPGVTIIVGANGAGKTNLLEAAQFTLCGSSFRTNRDSEMISEGADFFRAEAGVENGATSLRAISLAKGESVSVDAGGGPKWLEPGLVLCFSPDDLQLVKGPPAGRRRFLDEAIAKRSTSYKRFAIDYQKTLAQRNSFLQRARAGLVQLSDIAPWDRQLSTLALSLFVERKRHCQSLSPHFEIFVNEITGGAAAAQVGYVSQLEEVSRAVEPEAALVALLRKNWLSDLERLSTSTGTHRDDVEFILEGRSLKSFGSQGEQRAAVLALLLAERKLTTQEGMAQPLLLLDDVMSELDPDRRQRLMDALSGRGAISNNPAAGQVIITAADRGLFSEEDLELAQVVSVSGGRLTALAV